MAEDRTRELSVEFDRAVVIPELQTDLAEARAALSACQEERDKFKKRVKAEQARVRAAERKRDAAEAALAEATKDG